MFSSSCTDMVEILKNYGIQDHSPGFFKVIWGFLQNHPIPMFCLAVASTCTLLLFPTNPPAKLLHPCMQLFQNQSMLFSASGPLYGFCQSCWRATKLLQSCEACSSRCCWQHPHAVKWSWQPARLPVFCQLRLFGLLIPSAAAFHLYTWACLLHLGWETAQDYWLHDQKQLISNSCIMLSVYVMQGSNL